MHPSLLLLPLLLASVKAAPVATPGLTRLTASNAGNVLHGAARSEWHGLSSNARHTAAGMLQQLFISEADADMVHFDRDGHIYMADKFEGLTTTESDDNIATGVRRRRAFSDADPDAYAASGRGAGGGCWWVLVGARYLIVSFDHENKLSQPLVPYRTSHISFIRSFSHFSTYV